MKRSDCTVERQNDIQPSIILHTVAIGIYLRVLYALQLDEDILWLAKEDKLGKALQDLNLKNRERASKK